MEALEVETLERRPGQADDRVEGGLAGDVVEAPGAADIGTRQGLEGVGPQAARQRRSRREPVGDQHVVAGTQTDDVGVGSRAAAADDVVVPVAGLDPVLVVGRVLVGRLLAPHPVGTLAAHEGVVAEAEAHEGLALVGPGAHEVVAGTGVDDGRAAAGDTDGVVAGAGVDPRGALGHDHVVACGADQRLSRFAGLRRRPTVAQRCPELTYLPGLCGGSPGAGEAGGGSQQQGADDGTRACRLRMTAR